MREIIELFIHFICTLAKLLKPGGVKVVMAESMAIKQQLIIMNRGKKRTPKLTTFDRFYFGFVVFFVDENRLQRISVILKPATILRFHKMLRDRKYRGSVGLASHFVYNELTQLQGHKDMISFNGHRYPSEIILQTIRWYLAYPLSTRNLEEMLQERGISVDHSTINDWVLKLSPMLAEAFQKKKRKSGGRLRMDETYIKIKGKWYYLYRAVDKAGETADFMLTKHRDKKAVKRFLKKLVSRNGKPSLINIDKSGANLAGIKEHNQEHNTRIEIRQCKYLNNIVESDHRNVKRKMNQMMGFKSFNSARRTIAGIETWQMIRKGQKRWGGSACPAEQFYALVA